jgi:hypothetical protein
MQPAYSEKQSEPQTAIITKVTKTHWTAYAIAAGALLTPLTIGGTIFAVVQLGDRSRLQQEIKFDQVVRELHDARAATWIDATSVHHNCLATNAEITCTFTNGPQTPISTCVRGSLTNKKNKELAVTSMIICSGRLAPLETKTVSAPWAGGFARDVCSTVRAYIGETLDWSKCDFSSSPYDPSKDIN